MTVPIPNQCRSEKNQARQAPVKWRDKYKCQGIWNNAYHFEAFKCIFNRSYGKDSSAIMFPRRDTSKQMQNIDFEKSRSEKYLRFRDVKLA